MSSYLAFPSLPVNTGGLFLLHFPWSRLRLTLSVILPCEARTFLTVIPFGNIPRDRLTELPVYYITFSQINQGNMQTLTQKKLSAQQLRRAFLSCNLTYKPGSVENGHQSSLAVTDELKAALSADLCHLRIYVGQTIRLRCCFG